MNDEIPIQISLPKDTGPHVGANMEWWNHFAFLNGEHGGKYAIMASFFRMGERESKKGHFLIFTFIDLHRKVKQTYSFMDSKLKKHLISIYLPCYLLLHPTDTRMWKLYRSLVMRQPPNPHKKIKTIINKHPTQLIYGAHRLTFNGEKQDSFDLQFVEENVKINLQSTPVKPLALIGGDGKPHDLYYYSFPKNDVHGIIEMDEGIERVQGQGWFDHQWGRIYGLIKEVGWNWFGLQIDDGRELLLHETWSAKKAFSPMATLIEKDGSVRFTKNVLIQEQKNWKITIPEFSMELHVLSVPTKQEMPMIGPIQTIWQGPCVFYGRENISNKKRKILMGKGFIDLVGYAM